MKHKAEFKPRKRPVPIGIKNVECDLHCNRKIYRGTDQVGKLCRELKTGTLEIYRGEMLCLTVNVESRKDKSLLENDKTGFSAVKYRPFLACGIDTQSVKDNLGTDLPERKQSHDNL